MSASTDAQHQATATETSGARRSFWDYFLLVGVLTYFSFGRIDNRWLSLSGWQIGLILSAVAVGGVAYDRAKRRRRADEAVAGR